MKLDELGGAVWRRVGTRRKSAFFSAVIAGYLAHLYAFTNIIPNADGLSRVYDLQQMTVSGRWFLHYATALNNFTQMPAVIGLLSLIFIGLAAALLLIMIFIESNKPQSQSKDALVRWFAILIISFVALELLNAFVFK